MSSLRYVGLLGFMSLLQPETLRMVVLIVVLLKLGFRVRVRVIER